MALQIRTVSGANVPHVIYVVGGRLPRLRRGRVPRRGHDGEFWSLFTACGNAGDVQSLLTAIDAAAPG